MPTSTSHRIHGRIRSYDAAAVEDIDTHLLDLTISWAKYCEAAPPDDKMAAAYQADVDLLLERRHELTR